MTPANDADRRKQPRLITACVLAAVRICAFLWLCLSGVMALMGVVDAAFDGRSVDVIFVSTGGLASSPGR